MTVWFVTGTDTEVGKTITTAAVTAWMLAHGRSPYVLKPAQTGVRGTEPGDLDEVRRLIGPVPGNEGVRLSAPLAPDAAARLEGTTLPSLAEQTAGIVRAAGAHDVVVEGAGGVLVPIGDDWNLLDLAREVSGAGQGVRFLVVARSGLGTLNHSALTVGAITATGLDVAGVVIGSWPETPDLAETQNLTDLPRITGVPIIGRIPAAAGSRTPAEFVAQAPGWISLPD